MCVVLCAKHLLFLSSCSHTWILSTDLIKKNLYSEILWKFIQGDLSCSVWMDRQMGFIWQSWYSLFSVCKCALKGKIVPVHATESYWEGAEVCLHSFLIKSLDGDECSACFLSSQTLVEKTQGPLNKRLCGFQSSFQNFWRRSSFYALWLELDPRFSSS